MAQDTVERILGRILTDAGFRARFFAHTRDQLSDKLDPRIVRG